MTSAPVPVTFEPIFKPKPWGGRRLEELFGKPLPEGERIGESWELVSLPGDESRVRGGPLAGRTLSEVAEAWGSGLLGAVQPVGGRFPLLVKFLDARENLSIQVHPRPDRRDGEGAAPIKHEAWFVVDAEPGAEIFIGVREGVTVDHLAQAADTPALANLLRRWPARPGECYYLPSGTPHALGAGIVVAEIQTPSDVTYRLYDWGRVDAEGRPRELHIDQALANVRVDVAADEIRQRRRHVGSVFSTSTRIVSCEAFVVERVRIVEGLHEAVPYSDLAVWIILEGRGAVTCRDGECPFRPGDVVLIPAGVRECAVRTEADCAWLDVKLPLASSLGGMERPAREQRPAPRGSPVGLTRSGRQTDDETTGRAP